MQPICLTEKACQRIQQYAEIVGIPTEQAVSEACIEWMESIGDDLIYMILKRRKALLDEEEVLPVTSLVCQFA